MGNNILNNSKMTNCYHNCAEGIAICCQTCSTNCPREEFVFCK